MLFVHVFVGLLFIDETGHDSRQQLGLVFGKEPGPQTFGYQKGLVDAQLGSPKTVLTQPVAVVHKAGLLEKIEMAHKFMPQVAMGGLRPGQTFPLVLESRQGAMQQRLDFRRGVGEQQVQSHAEIDADLAVHRAGGPSEQLRHLPHIHVLARHHQGKTHLIFAAASGAAGHLQQFGGVQRHELAAVEAVRIEQSHGAGRKIHPCRHRGCGENGIQQSLAHQGLQDLLPGRQLAAVMRTHRQVLHQPALTVASDVDELIAQLRNAPAQGLGPQRVLDAVLQTQLQGLVAIGARF